jgi:hypothetical protein
MKQIQFLSILRVLPMIAMLSMLILSGCEKDEDPGVRPRVSSTDPVSNATGIALNNNISAIFSMTMDASTSAKLTLKHGDTNIEGTSVYSGTTASFTPTASLLPNTLYTATISKTAENEAGRSMLQDYTWNFTTGAAPDISKPTLTATTPGSNATGVALDHAVVLTFSEPMEASTINPLTFTLKQGTTVVAGTVTSTGSTATFTPAVNLAANKTYTATISTGAKDKAGNALAASHSFSFTTAIEADITLPRVNATGPVNNATNVSVNKVLAVTFSEQMDPLTISTTTFTLMQGTTQISGTVAYSGFIGTFTPENILDDGEVYTATITTGAKDLAANALAANTVWTFTTGSTSSLSTINLGSAGNYVILAKTAINNSATSAVTGDMALSPAATSYITGFALTDATGYATSSQITGKVYAADMADPTPINLTTAVGNMITAYNDAAGRPSPDFSELGTGNIGGKTLTPGLYKWTNTVTMPSDVVISGDATDIWIFQIAGDLTMSSAVNITLTGGAQAKNIFWQVAGQATIGTTAHFEGNILSMTGITFQTGASINGRALAQTAVILDSNAVTKPQ